MKLNEIADVQVKDPEVKSNMQTQKPKTYMCILHNDDFTDGMALIQLIKKHFRHNDHAAMQIVMRAHEDGQSPCGGPYNKDEAETRANAAEQEAEMHPAIGGGPAPLKISVEEITY